MKKNYRKYLVIVILIAYLVILLGNFRLLIWGKKIEIGENYYVENYGNMLDNKQATLICKYFNGRKVLTKVFRYSPNNIMGLDSCPIWENSH